MKIRGLQAAVGYAGDPYLSGIIFRCSRFVVRIRPRKLQVHSYIRLLWLSSSQDAWQMKFLSFLSAAQSLRTKLRVILCFMSLGTKGYLPT